ncbi:hypothetical protein [Sphingopyxis sp. JAI128]|uniref:hypothetical protein n=1 Tax=Sphingopyxis sp. JAI128 TaxID=2723066 RepID=UPI00161D3501|nr:hypothetical protein [Sphingopyxis sp. JAI128]MBB6425409.1 hypothetical protein [Sphingopyxis sp. JAI128]
MKFFVVFVLTLAGTAASAQSSDDKMEAFVQCRVDGPRTYALALGHELRNDQHGRYYTRPMRVDVPRSQFERRRATIPDNPWGEESTDRDAFRELYGDEALERIGLSFAQRVWGDQIGTRPQDAAGVGQWKPGNLFCFMNRSLSQFQRIEYDNDRYGRQIQIPTDWIMDRTISLTGEYKKEQQAKPISTTSPGRRADIVIQDATPARATPEEMAASLLQSKRKEAAQMAKAAAESARNNADIKAKIAKAVEEARKRGNAQ